MSDDKTPEERLAAIEALIQERKEITVAWREKVDGKLDRILTNHQKLVTPNMLEKSIAAHAESCPNNPGNPIKSVNMAEVLKQNLKPIMAIIGILGTAVTTINLLVVGLLKVLKVI